MADPARADELYQQVEAAAFQDGRALRDLRDRIATDDLLDAERDELAGLCDVYLHEMAASGFEGESGDGNG